MCHQRRAMLRRWARASRVPDTGGRRGIDEEECKQASTEIVVKSFITKMWQNVSWKICIELFGVGELDAHL